jgi:hypothetical protein
MLFLLIGMTPVIWAGPPEPAENHDEVELEELEEEAIVFSENYLELILELEDILDEFEYFFEEFGQASLDEMTDEIEEFRSSLYDEYSEEAFEEIMDEMDNVLDELDEIKSDMEDIDSRSQRKYLRRLRAFQKDLEDIREDLRDQFSDDRYSILIDSENLRLIINRAIKESRKVREEYGRSGRGVYPTGLPEREPKLPALKESDYALPAVPEPPEMPAPTIVMPQIDFSEWYHEHSAYMNIELDAYINHNSAVPVDDDNTIIEIHNDIGAVNITTWNRSQVDAILTIDYNESLPKSKELAEAIEMITETGGDNIRFEVVYPYDKEKTAGIVASRMEISLPRSNPVTVKNSFGPVKVIDLQNNLKIESNFASIEVQRLEGDANIRNSTGPIYLEEVSGNISVFNSFGKIEAVGLSGKIVIANNYANVLVKKSEGYLTISNSGGVTVERHEGDANIEVSNGAVEVYELDGDLKLSNSFGAIHIENITGDVEVQNSNDMIEIRDIGGRLSASNSFSPIYVDGVEEDIEISSSNSQVSIENARGQVAIKNSFGKVMLEMVEGPIIVENSNAPVIINKAGEKVNVSNQFGPVYMASVTGDATVKNKNSSVDLIDITGYSMVKNSFGLVTGEKLKGSVFIHNENGSVEIAKLYMERQDSCKVSTTFGDINLILLKPLNYNITAQTTGGKVRSDLPLVFNTNGNISIADYTGAVVGPTITIKGQNSSIYISAEE